MLFFFKNATSLTDVFPSLLKIKSEFQEEIKLCTVNVTSEDEVKKGYWSKKVSELTVIEFRVASVNLYACVVADAVGRPIFR